ncbi:MAG: hypothetical protein WC683_03015 [bacterium]
MPWCYATSREAEAWNGNFATREEAIEEGTREYEGDADHFFVACGECPDPADAMPRALDIIEMMVECAGDEWGEIAEDWPEVSKEEEKELDDILEGWARKHCRISFFMVDGDKAEEVRIAKAEEPKQP